MILTLCIAGFNTRFHNAGFDVPKYLLPWDDGVIVSGILKEMNTRFSFSRIMLLANQRDRYFRKELLSAVEQHGVAEADVFYIPDTKGQAHTAAVASQFVIEEATGSGEPIAFHNADTVLVGRNWSWVDAQLRTRDVFVDVFPASSPAYSHVALHEGRVTRIKEKQVISPFASSGFYGFRNATAYLDAFERHSATIANDPREIYISEVIESMINGGADVFINELNQTTSTIVMGKPEEYGLELARKAMLR